MNLSAYLDLLIPERYSSQLCYHLHFPLMPIQSAYFNPSALSRGYHIRCLVVYRYFGVLLCRHYFYSNSPSCWSRLVLISIVIHFVVVIVPLNLAAHEFWFPPVLDCLRNFLNRIIQFQQGPATICLFHFHHYWATLSSNWNLSKSYGCPFRRGRSAEYRRIF